MGPTSEELRLALAMRGGVSLAVWIGGACGEIDELRRGESEFWSALSEACGFDKVVVDVITGASAGGLNGALFAAALRHDFKMVEMRRLWGELASVDRIARYKKPWLSIFDGDGAFLAPLYRELKFLTAGGSPGRGSRYIDLQLTATLVEALEVPSHRLADEQLWRSKSAARFHFRHEAAAIVPERDLEGDDAALWRLALAARATSSFPVAFEPAIVRSRRPQRFGDAPPAEPGPLVDCREVFSDTRGTAASPGAEPLGAARSDFVVEDGGILDNIPIGRAIEAIAAAPADGPTKRVLLYLHPTGPTAPPDAVRHASSRGTRASGLSPKDEERRRGLWAVVHSLRRTMVRSETIDADIEQLQQFNAAVRRTKLARRAALARERRADIPCDSSVFALVWSNYVDQRSASDAESAAKLLEDPVATIGSDPFPAIADEDRWRSPLSGLGQRQRVMFNEAVADAYRDVLTMDQNGGSEPVFRAVFGTDISALSRVVDLLLEWVRALPGDIGAEAKPILYHLGSLVRALAEIHQLAWVVLSSSGDVPEILRFIDELSSMSAEAADAAVHPGADISEYLDGVHVELQRVVDELALEPVSSESLKPLSTDDAAQARTVSAENVDLRIRIAEALVERVSDLQRRLTPDMVPNDSPAALLHHLLVSDTERSVKDRLIALEIEGLGEQIAGCLHGEETEFVRVSAAASTPLADEFVKLRRATRTLDRRRSDGWVGRENFLRPEVKLSGDDLGNFSAFLDRRWRDNDWMWGRLDAASDLVELLVDRASRRCVENSGEGALSPLEEICARFGLPQTWTRERIKEELVARRQRQILEELLVDPGDIRSYGIGLETPTNHSSWAVTENVRTTVRNTFRVLRHAIASRSSVLLIPVGMAVEALAALWARPDRHERPDPFRPPAPR